MAEGRHFKPKGESGAARAADTGATGTHAGPSARANLGATEGFRMPEAQVPPARPMQPYGPQGDRAQGVQPVNRDRAYRPADTRAAAYEPYDLELDGTPRRRKRAILPILLIVIGIALLLTAGGLFIKAQMGYRQAKDSYGKLEQYAVADDSGDGVPAVDFDALAQINPEVVGWIYVPGTVINYPVVQTDNNTKYLTQMFDGTNNGNGAIFMDKDDTAPGVVDQQTTLYGHHMYDASMFNIIDKSLDQSVFDTFTSVYYITRDATYEFKPLFTVQVSDEYAEARQPNFTDQAAMTQYLEALLGQAQAKAADVDQRAGEAKQVLTLVTCNQTLVPTDQRAVMACTLEQTIAHE